MVEIVVGMLVGSEHQIGIGQLVLWCASGWIAAASADGAIVAAEAMIRTAAAPEPAASVAIDARRR